MTAWRTASKSEWMNPNSSSGFPMAPPLSSASLWSTKPLSLRASRVRPLSPCHHASMPPRGSAALGPTANRQPLTATTFVYPFQALSSAGQNSGLIIRKSRVRIPQGQPL